MIKRYDKQVKPGQVDGKWQCAICFRIDSSTAQVLNMLSPDAEIVSLQVQRKYEASPRMIEAQVQSEPKSGCAEVF
jgi:ubiquitin C-terminal hydrolase